MHIVTSILDWIGRFQVIQWLLTLIKPLWFPVLAAVLAFTAGYRQDLPWAWIVMAASLTFMGIIVSMFFVASYSDMRTPAHKLRYVNTVVGVDLRPPPNRKAKRGDQSSAVNGVTQGYLDKTQFGVQLHNSANFPVSAFVESAESKLGDNDPPRTSYPKPSITINPGGTVNMMDIPIEMDGAPCCKLDGLMKIKIRYGRKGREKYELFFSAKLEVYMRKDGLIQGISTAWDSNRYDAIAPPS